MIFMSMPRVIFITHQCAEGLPSDKELELLLPFKDELPERVFTQEWIEPDTDGFGQNRERIARALELFAEAGYSIIDGVADRETGEPFTIDFIFVSCLISEKACHLSKRSIE